MVAKGLAGFLVLAHALVALPAHAEEPESFRLSWVRGEGAGTCPDGRTLAARVSERLGRNPFSETGAQSIEGSVVVRDGRFQAELRVRDAGGVARGSRELSANGSDCVELAEAVVLAVALTIDPNAALGGPPAQQAPLPVPLAAPPSEPPALQECPAVRCPPSEACPLLLCPATAPSLHHGLVARALLAAGVLPGLAPGAAVFGEIGTRRLRAALGMRYFPERDTSDGRYGFGLTTGTAGAVVVWPLAPGFELSALAELEIGAIHAVVREREPVEPGDQPWFAASAGPRVALSKLAPFRVELGVSLIVPMIRPAFDERGVSEPVFQSAPVAGLGYLGVGLGTP